MIDEQQQSAEDQGMSSGAGDSAEIIMSGRYEMDVATGKLLNPNRNHAVDLPQEMAGMHEQSAWGARRFSEYFIQVLEYTWKSGDSSLLREVSLPECVWCWHYIQLTEERSAAGGWVDEANFSAAKVEDAFEIEGHPGLWNTTIDVIQGKRTVYNGLTVEKADENRALLYIQTRFEDGRWRVWAVIAEQDQK